MRNGADRRHQAECDRQIVMAAFLRQIGRSQIDGDSARRQRQPGGDQRTTNALPRLGDRPYRRGRRRGTPAGPGATCTCTSTARASMPSNATVETRWTIGPRQ